MPFTQEHADLGIILYFLVDSLVTDPLEGTGLGLAEYENAMGALRNQVGLIAHMALRQYDDAINAGKLVIRRPRAGTFQFKDGDGQVVVFAEVYRKFLDQGGSPEALIAERPLRSRSCICRSTFRTKTISWRCGKADRYP